MGYVTKLTESPTNPPVVEVEAEVVEVVVKEAVDVVVEDVIDPPEADVVELVALVVVADAEVIEFEPVDPEINASQLIKIISH